jgi:hypothetical protein
MTAWIKRYWPELLVFGTIFGILLADCMPAYTWINTDCDGIHYTFAAKYLMPAHKTSAPLFLLLGHLFVQLPFGSEGWRIALISVLCSTASAVFIYLIVRAKVQEHGRLYGIIGALIFGGSAIVISQSTIVESYALVTMFGIGAYYFAEKENWLACALMLGAGAATHHLIGITALVLIIAFKGIRKWKYIGIIAAFLLVYLYIPITNRAPYMWFPEPTTSGFLGNCVACIQSFASDNSNTLAMLGGGLAIWDLPKRILDTIGVVGVSLGLGSIPVIWAFIRKNGKKWYKQPLLWLFILPVVYYCTDLAPQTYVYVMPGIAFGAVIAGITLPRMKRYWKYIVLGGAVGIMIFNGYYFDIGRNLDPRMSAMEYYTEELPKVPQDGILLCQQGWEWTAVFMYNKEYGTSIFPIYTGSLTSPSYREELDEHGVKYIFREDVDTTAEKILGATTSILKMNEGIWVTNPADPRTYGSEVVPAKGNMEKLEWVNAPLVSPNEVNVQWKPSNPYDIITGAIEVEEWVNVSWTNYSVMLFLMMALIGAIPCWILWMIIVKKKKWTISANTEKEVMKE